MRAEVFFVIKKEEGQMINYWRLLNSKEYYAVTEKKDSGVLCKDITIEWVMQDTMYSMMLSFVKHIYVYMCVYIYVI